MRRLTPALICLGFLTGAPGQEAASLPDSSDPERGLDLGAVALTPLYEADFSSPLRLVREPEMFEGDRRVREPKKGVDWVLEGAASARIENGRLRLVNDSNLIPRTLKCALREDKAPKNGATPRGVEPLFAA